MDTPLFLGAQQRDGRFVNRDGSGAPPFSRVFKWAVRDKLAAMGIVEEDVAAAVAWARKGGKTGRSR